MASAVTRRQLKLNLHKLALARSDMASCAKTCELFLAQVTGLNHPLYFPLFHAIVISYARPFTDGGLGRLSRHWGEFDTPGPKVLHQRILKTRNEIVAHSDVQARALWVVPPGTEAFPGAKTSMGMTIRLDSYGFEQEFFINAFRLASIQVERMSSAIEEHLVKLYDGQQLPTEQFQIQLDDGF